MHRLVSILILTLLLIGSTQAEAALPDSIYRVGATATPGVTWDVFVQGNYAYVADRGFLTIVDVSTLSTPWVVSNVSDIDFCPVGIVIKDTIAYLNNGLCNRFSNANVANPTTPFKIDWLTIPPATPEPKGVSVLDTFAFIADSDDGLIIANISDPSNLTLTGSYNTPGIAIDLFVKDSLVYIADQDSLQIINVTDPTSPTRLGAVAMPTSCYDVAVMGNYAFVACQSNTGTDGRLEVVEVSDPTSPSIVATVNTINGDPFAVYIQGNYVYVVAQDHILPSVEGGVRIVDISNPLSPVLIASYDTPGDPRGIFTSFPYIFIADQDSLQILEHIIVGIDEEETGIDRTPILVRLEQNMPNPFAHHTAINYQISSQSSVSLNIYDVSGRLIRSLVNESQSPGRHTAYWNGEDNTSKKVASGVYLYQLISKSREGEAKFSRKIIFLH